MPKRLLTMRRLSCRVPFRLACSRTKAYAASRVPFEPAFETNLSFAAAILVRSGMGVFVYDQNRLHLP